MQKRERPFFSIDVARKYPDRFAAILTALDGLTIFEATHLLIVANREIDKVSEKTLLTFSV